MTPSRHHLNVLTVCMHVHACFSLGALARSAPTLAPSRQQHRHHDPWHADAEAREQDREAGDEAAIKSRLLKLLEEADDRHAFRPHFRRGSSYARRPTPPWPYDWERFPAYRFPQNTSGMESEASVEADVRYSLVVIGGLHNVLNESRREEDSLYEQCAVLRRRNPALVCIVYRQAFRALSNFAWSRLPAENAGTRPYWWVVDDDGRPNNASLPEYGLWALTFDWRNASAQAFYVQDAIGEALAEWPRVQGVFFDDFDGEGCLGALNASLPAHYTAAEVGAMYAARLAMYGEVLRLMNARGMTPVLGMSSRFRSTANGCLLPEEAVLERLGDDAGFLREAIFDRPVSQSTPQGCSEFMTSTLEEVSSHIPTLFWSHTGPGGNLSSLAIPAFLIVRMEFSYFGTSSGWSDSDWTWHKEFDAHYGTPLEQPQVMYGKMVFSRKYSNCVAVLDCRRLEGCVDFS